jgi:beta-glucanase (GH16 family)
MRKQLILMLMIVLSVGAVVLWGLRPAGAGSQGAPAVEPKASAQPSASLLPHEPAGSVGEKLAFNASFSGSRLDASVWATCYPWMDAGSGCTNFGNADEREWYLASQDQVSGGVLHLVAQGIRTLGKNSDGAPREYLCRSGMVTTYPSFRFEYGRVQVVAQIPSRTGLWSALWLAAANFRWPPEIDILEHWGRASHSGVFFHPVGAVQLAARPATGNLSAGWHTFGLTWTPSSLTWFIDGHVVMSTRHDIPHQVMYFIADLADTGSTASAASCSGALLIRSVQVWQRSARN